MFIPIDRQKPVGEQIYQHLLTSIRSGKLPPDSPLPSSRRLAQELDLSRNTVLAAYHRLASEGVIETRGTAGTFVSAAIPLERLPRSSIRIEASPDKCKAPIRLSTYARRAPQFAQIYPPPRPTARQHLRYDFGRPYTLQDRTALRAWYQLLRRQANESEAVPWHQASSMGNTKLRETLAQHLRTTRGVVADADQVIIVTRSQQAFKLTAELLVDPGDIVVIEEPHYLGARNAFRAAGARLVPAPVDKSGLQVELIPAEAKGAKLIYVVPSHQWPTGGTLSPERRRQLLAWATANDAYIYEDDWNCEYRLSGSPLQSLQGQADDDRVIYGGTLTQFLLPLHPIGYLVVPRNLLEAYRALSTLECFQPSPFEQTVMAEFVAAGHFERLTRRLRRQHAQMREALIRNLRAHLSIAMDLFPTSAGFHTYGRLRCVPAGEASRLIDAAGQVGVGLYVDLPHFIRQPDKLGLVFTSIRLTEEEIAAGLQRLAQVLRTWS